MDQYQVTFAPRAERDLKSVAFFIARRSSVDIAERFGTRLIDRALTLATMPERGRIVPELGNPEIREIIFKSYRIVYRIRSGTVEVIRFWHAARGTPEIDSDEFRS
jgi:plasmid stabilization system protein ParE